MIYLPGCNNGCIAVLGWNVLTQMYIVPCNVCCFYILLPSEAVYREARVDNKCS